MNLEGNKVTVNKSAITLCRFLSDVKNFEQLMPENTSKFEVIRENAFVFALKGMPEIALETKEITPPNKVVLGAISDKIPFTLTADIEEVTENTATVQLHFQGDFNAMMAMMIKGPISKFIETLTTNLVKI
ncbi:MAG: orotate phosphoribosyltransferase [Flavobacteriaceae bacterium CG_4_8_14_3_um_filter_34_10]|nr:SRPBCC family protein [Flavobacteriia bacterium]OIP49999.1 MAG: orotate phosphoribosyltransferase [Flavobacteriaceae bacterium CG2_30_34_30]PIQ19405.1 MAG: orotate phosphoribosyltransferase [Flavobacteriaceae bacterium CG18_big_fil_WC_8_21_14_2_50_34_36]PIV51027.1 MAG: orotate phosphoribosyltransferase [Flavobacteriaceae bacterium CG02_land_8_20_14_3_00_34_13]PIX08283.1 MAG: orotate phosphoribosyltransferase [Flavobacteriaceae bacterium CG_4_8_14_3_um_filter_34_10]PIZ06950.1 MAG: orotate ph